MLNLSFNNETAKELEYNHHIPLHKTAIRKHKKSIHHKKRLTIDIPSDVEVKAKKRREGIGDKRELGSCYAAILRKGKYKRYNEDRVII